MQIDNSGQDINFILDNVDSQSSQQIKTFEDWWDISTDCFDGDVDTPKDIARWAWEHIESLRSREIGELKEDLDSYMNIVNYEATLNHALMEIITRQKEVARAIKLVMEYGAEEDVYKIIESMCDKIINAKFPTSSEGT